MNKPLVMLLLAASLAAAAPARAQVVYIPEEIHYQAPQVPAFIEFAGQTYRFDRPDLYERMDRELITFTYGHTNSLLMLKRSRRIFSQVVPILKKNGIPEDLKYLPLSGDLSAFSFDTSALDSSWVVTDLR